MGNSSSILIPRTWRSELTSLVMTFFLSILSIYLSSVFPSTVIRGDIITIGSYRLMLNLPIFWFMPALTIFSAIYRIYNVRYQVTARGIEAEIGILAMQRRSIRLWYEDIRSFQTNQTILQRFLGIGDLEVGTAATGSVEVTLRGIAAPEEVQEMLQRERDMRQKKQHFLKNDQNSIEGSVVN